MNPDAGNGYCGGVAPALAVAHTPTHNIYPVLVVHHGEVSLFDELNPGVEVTILKFNATSADLALAKVAFNAGAASITRGE